MARSKRKGIPLPWEGRGRILRGVLAGPRWKIALGLLVVLLGAWLIYRAADREARMRETRAAIAEVHRAINEFRADMGRCPRSTEELLDPPRPADKYLRVMPRDGWGHVLWVSCPARDDPTGADVVSAGPSGDFFVDDNVK